MNKISGIKPHVKSIRLIQYSRHSEGMRRLLYLLLGLVSHIIYSICRYLESVRRKTLIVVPTKSLVRQMYKGFNDYGWDVKTSYLPRSYNRH